MISKLFRVHGSCIIQVMMKNITFSAKDELIEAARAQAKKENKSLNDLFREWLDDYVEQEEAEQRKQRADAFLESVRRFSFKSDRKYTREEMNER